MDDKLAEVLKQIEGVDISEEKTAENPKEESKVEAIEKPKEESKKEVVKEVIKEKPQIIVVKEEKKKTRRKRKIKKKKEEKKDETSAVPQETGPKKSGLGKIALIGAAVAAVAFVIYKLFSRKKKDSTQEPPAEESPAQSVEEPPVDESPQPIAL